MGFCAFYFERTVERWGFFPQAVRALNSDHPAPLWNPMQTPTSWNMDPSPLSPLPSPLSLSLSKHPPSLTTPKKKLWTFFVQFKCATHRWVGLYKPPVVAHSPLCTRHFSHTCVYTIPQKTQQYMFHEFTLTSNLIANSKHILACCPGGGLRARNMARTQRTPPIPNMG